MRRHLLIGAVSVLMATGCAGTGDTPPAAGPDEVSPPAALSGSTAPSAEASAAAQPLLARYGLAGKSAVEIIDRLDRLTLQQRPADLKASVRPGELVLSVAGQQYSLPIDGDRFYLSVAPYVQGTHGCFFHSLTMCKGELAGADMQVRIVDAAGTVLVDEKRTTFPNGFVGFWLPRDITGTLRIASGGKVAESAISTGPDAPTCLTTARLA